MVMMNPGAGMMAPPPDAEVQPIEAQPQGGEQPTGGLNISAQDFQMAIEQLDDQDIAALDSHLTPAIKDAMGRLLGPEVMPILEPLGPNEPTINVPVSVIATAYPAQDIQGSIEMMQQDMASKKQQNIPAPPQGGLGGEPVGDPQTNVPPSIPMMA